MEHDYLDQNEYSFHNAGNMQSETKQAGNTHERILAQALRLFTSKGFFNTSVHDVARAAEVSIGSIYHHFKDKESIALTLYDELVERMVESLEDITTKYATAHDRCQAIVRLLFKLTATEPETMEFMLYAKHREFLPDQGPICSSTPFEMMRRIVGQGIANNEIRQMDSMLASACLFGGPIRLITAHLDGVLELPLTEYLDNAWDCGWRAIAV